MVLLKNFKEKGLICHYHLQRYCLQLDNRSQIGVKPFEKFNWLPVSERFNQYLCSNTFKFLRKLVLDIYRQSSQNQANTRSSVLKLKHPLRNTYSHQKKLLYLRLIVWNSLPTDLKLANSLSNFKHKLKDHFSKKLRNMDQNAFAYWHHVRNQNCNILN